MWLEMVEGGAAAVSMVGVVLNVRHRRECLFVWVGTNAAWCAVDAWHGIYAQSLLHAVYFCLAVRGILMWRTKRGEHG